ncbi:MAG: glycosyltransferase [Bacteroidales bacterium]|nr:glycosyltransferase [Bacteroidales bacterium]
MLVGYEANNALRNSHEIGEFCRELISRLATGRVNSFRALLFSKRIKNAYKGYYSSYTNISTYVPTGSSKLMPSLWMRYSLNPWLKAEKVKIFHGLNEELPYGISRDIKTIITCYGVESHQRTSASDGLMWKRRMKYSFGAADIIVAANNDIRQHLIDFGVNADKIVVIGAESGNPYELTDKMVEQYFQLYQRLAGEENQ